MKICKKRYGNKCRFHAYLPNRGIPDILIGDENLIIEIKTNASDYSVRRDVKRYLPYCKRIEIWHLYGKPLRIKDWNVTYIGPNKIRKIIKEDKQLLAEFTSIVNELR